MALNVTAARKAFKRAPLTWVTLYAGRAGARARGASARDTAAAEPYGQVIFVIVPSE